MKVFKFICLNATTSELLIMQRNLGEVYDILKPAFQNYSSTDYPCIAEEVFTSMCIMVGAELNFREEAHFRAKSIADALLDEEEKARHASTADSAAAPSAGGASQP